MVNTKGNTFYTISEIASELKVDKRSIRFCEEKGLISPKVKTLNRRMYSEYDRARLELILHCEASGYSLDQVVYLIDTPDPELNKIEQFRKGLKYGEKRLDELIKQSEEMSFHQRTSIMTDISLMRQYVKNLQAIKTKFLDEYEAKPRRPEEKKVELEPSAAPEPVETVRTEPEEKPMRQPTRMVPVFTAGIVLILMIAGYFYYQKRTKDTKTINLAQSQTVTMEVTSSNQDSVPSAITANQDDVSAQPQELSSSTPLAQQDRLEESKELLDNVPSESQKETKIVLSKANLEAQETPIVQEQMKEETETPQTVVEQPSEPDTGDKASDQGSEPETKGVTVAAIAAVAAVAVVTEDQPPASPTVTPVPSEETALKPETSGPPQEAAPEPETPKPAQETTPEPVTDQEKPIAQEQIKEETETPQPEADQPPEPDTGDKASDQGSEPETKVATVAAVAAVAAVTEDQPPASPAVTPVPSEETAPKPETPEPAAIQETSIVASTEDTSKPEDHTNRLKAFLTSYCSIYETKDLDRFFTLFAPDATENDAPFNELKPKYQKNMEIIESFQYRIDMTNYASVPDTGNTLIQGNFYIRYRLQDGPWKENSGSVTMELTEKGDSYLVKRLNYGN